MPALYILPIFCFKPAPLPLAPKHTSSNLPHPTATTTTTTSIIIITIIIIIMNFLEVLDFGLVAVVAMFLLFGTLA